MLTRRMKNAAVASQGRINEVLRNNGLGLQTCLGTAFRKQPGNSEGGRERSHIRASINCFRNSEHASTARPEGVLSLAASDFAPGQTRRVDKRSKSLSCPPRAKQPFIARWLGRVKPTDGGCELLLSAGVKVSFF